MTKPTDHPPSPLAEIANIGPAIHKRDPRVQVVADLLATKDVRRTPSLESIAAVLNVSASRLRHLFKDEIGVSPKRYLRLLRLQQARKLLEGSFLSVKQVMTGTGFADPSHFVRDYKELFGQTPSQTRACAASVLLRKAQLAPGLLVRGFTPQSNILPGTEPGLKSLPLLKTSTTRDFRNVLLGYTAGFETLVFDFRHKEDGHSTEQTVVAFRQGNAALPRLQVGRKEVLQRRPVPSGYSTIELANFAGVCGCYGVRTADPRGAHKFFSPQVVELFQRLRNQSWIMEVCDSYAIIYTPEVKLAGKDLRRSLEQASHILPAVLRLSGHSTA